jgi:hypothetical protein
LYPVVLLLGYSHRALVLRAAKHVEASESDDEFDIDLWFQRELKNLKGLKCFYLGETP